MGKDQVTRSLQFTGDGTKSLSFQLKKLFADLRYCKKNWEQSGRIFRAEARSLPQKTPRLEGLTRGLSDLTNHSLDQKSLEPAGAKMGGPIRLYTECGVIPACRESLLVDVKIPEGERGFVIRGNS